MLVDLALLNRFAEDRERVSVESCTFSLPAAALLELTLAAEHRHFGTRSGSRAKFRRRCSTRQLPSGPAFIALGAIEVLLGHDLDSTGALRGFPTKPNASTLPLPLGNGLPDAVRNLAGA
jgi:hypothetical protein